MRRDYSRRATKDFGQMENEARFGYREPEKRNVSTSRTIEWIQKMFGPGTKHYGTKLFFEKTKGKHLGKVYSNGKYACWVPKFVNTEVLIETFIKINEKVDKKSREKTITTISS